MTAPTALGRETHTSFRLAALRMLEASDTAERRPLVIDLSATRQVDSVGLGALVLVQRRAAELRRAVLLRGASEEVRVLLVMSRLDDRFGFEDHAAQ